jgi:phosphatidylserine/phosphatidylglycerophosphate/cardiolipin synthase-like enzyme
MIETQAYFDNIKQVLLEQLDAAEKSIFVAVAWFTDKDLYEKLCSKTRSGLAVQIIIVDDDINNGSYGIDKQAIARAGGKSIKTLQCSTKTKGVFDTLCL